MKRKIVICRTSNIYENIEDCHIGNPLFVDYYSGAFDWTMFPLAAKDISHLNISEQTQLLEHLIAPHYAYEIKTIYVKI